MKKYCINLEIRQDRKERFIADNSSKLGIVEFLPAISGEGLSYSYLEELGIEIDHKWFDPILNRRLTKGEIGCLASHVLLWQTCVTLKEPIMIFEDDVIVHDTYDQADVEKLIAQGYDSIYLGHREMKEPLADLGDYVVPGFAYLNHAYVITPKAAKVLLAGLTVFGAIPVDELMPRCYDRLNQIAYKKDVVTQISREELGTNIEPASDYDYMTFKNRYVYTVATEAEKAHRLIYSTECNGMDLNMLGKGLDKFDMTNTGGGIKINLLREALKSHDDNDLILFLDGYDTFILGDWDEIEARFLGFGCDMVFSAETTCWPDSQLSHLFQADTDYKFLNSGTFIGRAGAIKALIAEEITNLDDDQRYITTKYLSGDHNIRLDTECYIFQTHADNVVIKNGFTYNDHTNCYAVIYHGNGGENAIAKLDEVFEAWKNPEYVAPYISKNLKFEPLVIKDQLDTDMFVTSFLNTEMCEYLMKVGDKNGSWEPLEYDKFPAQEIRVAELGLWEDFKGVWDEQVSKIYEQLWHPIQHYGLRDAFVMKYTVDTQRDLPLHHDASLVTGSVKLNDNYKGADLWFPRQRVSNRDVACGDMILFPGQVTHGHECLRLEEGTKYSLTMWTMRNYGDTM